MEDIEREFSALQIDGEFEYTELDDNEVENIASESTETIGTFKALTVQGIQALDS